MLFLSSGETVFAFVACMEQEEVLEGITVTDSHLDQAAALQQHQFVQQLQQQHMQALQQFWHDQLHEVDHLIDTKAKNGLPLARIKKIMKFDEDVKVQIFLVTRLERVILLADKDD